jgi:hypothetical protein
MASTAAGRELGTVEVVDSAVAIGTEVAVVAPLPLVRAIGRGDER